MTFPRTVTFRVLGILIAFPVLILAQEKKDNPLDNFDGSKKEITEVDPDSKKSENAEDSGSGKISLGDLTEENIKQDKMTESLENELESENAKGEQVDDIIQSALDKMKPALSSSGLELNQAEVFPADI